MNKKIAKLFSVLPISPSMRGMLYKLFLRAHIGKNFKIGFCSYIDARYIEIERFNPDDENSEDEAEETEDSSSDEDSE